MLVSARVEVKRGGISDIASGVVGHNGDVIAYLVLIRIAFKWIKRIAYLNVGRPGHAAVRAPRIK